MAERGECAVCYEDTADSCLRFGGNYSRPTGKGAQFNANLAILFNANLAILQLQPASTRTMHRHTDSISISDFVIKTCCGLEVDSDNKLMPCLDDAVPEAYPFCSVEHQKNFEKNFTQPMNANFYTAVAVINLQRADLHKQFYTEFLPWLYCRVATEERKDLIVYANDEEEAQAFNETFDALLTKHLDFFACINEGLHKLQTIEEDVHTLQKAPRIRALLQKSVDNAEYCEEFIPSTAECSLIVWCPGKSKDEKPEGSASQ